MTTGGWDYLLWLTGFALNLGLLCVLLHKRRFQKFPLVHPADRPGRGADHRALLRPQIPGDQLLYVLELRGARRPVAPARALRGGASPACPVRPEHRGRGPALLELSRGAGCGVLVAFAWLTPSSPYFADQVALRIGQMSSICVGGVTSLLILVTFFFGLRFRIHAQAGALWPRALHVRQAMGPHTAAAPGRSPALVGFGGQPQAGLPHDLADLDRVSLVRGT